MPLVPATGVNGCRWVIPGSATIYRELRQRGLTVRFPIDALIAAVAIRLDVPVLHRDRDFDAVARHTPLRVVEV